MIQILTGVNRVFDFLYIIDEFMFNIRVQYSISTVQYSISINNYRY